MKTKIAATVLFAFFLIIAKFFLFEYAIKVFLQTNAAEGTIVSFHFQTKKDGTVREGKAIVKHDGYLPLVIPAKNVVWFKVDMPAGSVKEALIKGKGKQRIALAGENGEFGPLSLKGKTHFDFNILIVVYMTLFWLRTMMKGLPAAGPVPTKMMNVEFLRILFTVDVVLAHFIACLNVPFNAGLPVEFFFILSGYFLALKFNPDKTVPQIAKARFAAWMPLIVFGGLLCNGNLQSFKALLFLQSTGIAFDNVPNAPAWYLAILFWVSIFYFCVFRAFKAETAKLVVGTLSFLLSVVCAQTGVGIWDRIFLYFPRGLITGTACVGIGCMLAQVCVRNGNASVKKGAGVVEALLLAYVVVAGFVKGAAFREWAAWIIVYVALIALFIRKEGAVSRFFERPVFARAAQYSLSVYLTHWFLSVNFQDAISVNLPWVMAHKFLVAAMMLTASALLGIIARHAVEIPFGNWLKKKLG